MIEALAPSGACRRGAIRNIVATIEDLHDARSREEVAALLDRAIAYEPERDPSRDRAIGIEREEREAHPPASSLIESRPAFQATEATIANAAVRAAPLL